MKELSDLKKIEKRLYFSYANDGLADIVMGLWMILAGFFMLIEQTAFMGLSGLPVLFYIPVKKRVIIPRMGDVSFSKNRKKKISSTLMISIIAGAVLLLFLVFHFKYESGEQLIRANLHVVFGLLIAILFSFVALFTTITRFYLYAILSILLFSINKLIVNSVPLTQLIFGAVVFITGIIYLVHFLINNPVSGGLVDEN